MCRDGITRMLSERFEYTLNASRHITTLSGKIIIVKCRLDALLSTCFCIINCWKQRLVSFLGLKGGKILWICWMKSFGGWHRKSLKNCWLVNAFRSHRSINRWQTLNDSWLENINKTVERLHCSEVGAFYAQCLSKISWCPACTNQNTCSWIEEKIRKKKNTTRTTNKKPRYLFSSSSSILI